MDSPTRAGEGDVPGAVDVTTTDGIAGVGDRAFVGAALGGTAVADGTGDAPGPAASAGGFRVAAATESAASTAMNAIAAMAYF